MTTKNNDRKQIDHFQSAVSELVDQYLKDGLDPELIQEVLESEAEAVPERHAEMQSSKDNEE